MAFRPMYHPGHEVLRKNCFACHQSTIGPIPFLPFANYQQLGEALRGNNGRLYQNIKRRISFDEGPSRLMPLGGPTLTIEEQEDLLTFLELLLKSSDQ